MAGKANKILFVALSIIILSSLALAIEVRDGAVIDFFSSNDATQDLPQNVNRPLAYILQDNTVNRTLGKVGICPTISEIDGHKEVRVQNIIFNDGRAHNLAHAAFMAKNTKSLVRWYVYGGCADDRLHIRASLGQEYDNSSSISLFDQNSTGPSGDSQCKSLSQSQLPVDILGQLDSNFEIDSSQNNWVTLAAYATGDANTYNAQYYSCAYTSCDYDGDGKLAVACGGDDENDFNEDSEDTTPPGAVSDLHLESRTSSSLSWAWTNPSDSDFEKVIVKVDGIVVGEGVIAYYSALGLAPGTSHTISITTVDTSGNINTNAVSRTDQTLQLTNESDTTPPGTISNLAPSDITTSSITWTWTNPSDLDFSHVIIQINGEIMNITGTSYTASSLQDDTDYTITIRTSDLNGNINPTNVSNTARTLRENQDDDDDNGQDDDKDDRVRRKTNSFADYTPLEQNRSRIYEEETFELPPAKAEEGVNIVSLLLLIGITLMLILILIVLLMS